MTTSNALAGSFVSMEQFALQPDQAGRQRLLVQLQARRADLDKEIAAYEKTIFSDADRELFERFKRARADYGRVTDEILAAAPSQQSKDLIAAVATRLVPEFEQTKAAIDAVFAHNRASAAASFEAITSSINSATTGLFATFAAAVIFAGLCGITLLRAITRPLGTLTHIVEVMRKGDFTQRALVHRRDELGALAEGFNRMTEELTTLVGHVQKSGLQVTTSVTEIAATAREQQATATEIAATTTEIGATSKEISATSKELVKTMTAVSEVAEQSAALAGAGQTGLTQMEQTIRHVMDAAGSVTAKLATLNERAADISQVVTTITKVADQTNLLSLNAAIEAEKAGEYGRGFAVVATEMRRLADQTAAATYDIDQMVKGIQSAVSAGVMSMDKFSEEVRRGLPGRAGRRQSTDAGDPAGAGAGAALRGGERRHAGAGGRRRADHRGADAAERRRASDGGVAASVESGDQRAERCRDRTAHRRVEVLAAGRLSRPSYELRSYASYVELRELREHVSYVRPRSCCF